MTNSYEPETHFVGDSMTAQALGAFQRDMEARFDDLDMHIEHIVRHDRLTPTHGCKYCEVRRAA